VICSFTHAFAYLYSSKVATVLEGYVVSVVEPWHYSLYAFMDGIESFYGSEMKDKIDGDTLVLTQYVRMKEFHLYGSSRLGILNQNDTLKRADLHYKLSLSDPSQEPELFVETQDLDQYAPDSIYTLKQGNRLYEGSNHLGHLLVTFSDKRIGYCTNDSIYYYRADVRTANDYAAFGAPLDDRQWYSTADSGVYRFGFNGQEKDNEVSGFGNSNTAEFWQYDSRLGRRWNLDPKPFHAMSAFSCFGNNPIVANDPKGDIFKIATNDETEKDLRSTVAAENQKFIKIGEDGSVTLDFRDMKQKKIDRRLKRDEGLSLINNLSTAKDAEGKDESFYFESSNHREINYNGVDMAIDLSVTPGQVTPSDDNRFVTNLSTTPFGDDKKYTEQNKTKPANGYDGAVYISPGTMYDLHTVYDGEQRPAAKVEGVVPRKELIYHELNENYLRTHLKQDYATSHSQAGGTGSFTKFKYK